MSGYVEKRPGALKTAASMAAFFPRPVLDVSDFGAIVLGAAPGYSLSLAVFKTSGRDKKVLSCILAPKRA